MAKENVRWEGDESFEGLKGSMEGHRIPLGPRRIRGTILQRNDLKGDLDGTLKRFGFVARLFGNNSYFDANLPRNGERRCLGTQIMKDLRDLVFDVEFLVSTGRAVADDRACGDRWSGIEGVASSGECLGWPVAPRIGPLHFEFDGGERKKCRGWA